MARATASASSSSRSSWAGRRRGARPGTYSKRAASASSGPSGPSNACAIRCAYTSSRSSSVRSRETTISVPRGLDSRKPFRSCKAALSSQCTPSSSSRRRAADARWWGPHGLLGSVCSRSTRARLAAVVSACGTRLAIGLWTHLDAQDVPQQPAAHGYLVDQTQASVAGQQIVKGVEVGCRPRQVVPREYEQLLERL